MNGVCALIVGTTRAGQECLLKYDQHQVSNQPELWLGDTSLASNLSDPV